MINQRFGEGVSNLSTVAELRMFDGTYQEKHNTDEGEKSTDGGKHIADKGRHSTDKDEQCNDEGKQ
jgi:hypothetical protein